MSSKSDVKYQRAGVLRAGGASVDDKCTMADDAQTPRMRSLSQHSAGYESWMLLEPSEQPTAMEEE